MNSPRNLVCSKPANPFPSGTSQTHQTAHSACRHSLVPCSWNHLHEQIWSQDRCLVLRLPLCGASDGPEAHEHWFPRVRNEEGKSVQRTTLCSPLSYQQEISWCMHHCTRWMCLERSAEYDSFLHRYPCGGRYRLDWRRWVQRENHRNQLWGTWYKRPFISLENVLEGSRSWGWRRGTGPLRQDARMTLSLSSPPTSNSTRTSASPLMTVLSTPISTVVVTPNLKNAMIPLSLRLKLISLPILQEIRSKVCSVRTDLYSCSFLPSRVPQEL